MRDRREERMALLKFNDFKEEVVRALREKYDVRVEPVVKNNGLCLTGLIVSLSKTIERENGISEVSPTLYAEYMYEEYKSGRTIDEIIEKITNVVENSNDYGSELMDTILIVRDFEKVKEFILPYVINTELNEEMIKEIPNRQFLDLTIAYRVFFNREENQTASILIRNGLMESWNITEEQLYETAMKNLMAEEKLISIPSVSDMFTVLTGLAGNNLKDFLINDAVDNKMWVVTNRCKLYGAILMLNKELMSKLYRGFGKEMIVIPSSVHELILIDETGIGSGDFDINEMNEIISEINETQLQRDEILSNHCYRLTEKGLEIA